MKVYFWKLYTSKLSLSPSFSEPSFKKTAIRLTRSPIAWLPKDVSFKKMKHGNQQKKPAVDHVRLLGKVRRRKEFLRFLKHKRPKQGFLGKGDGKAGVATRQKHKEVAN